MAAVLNSRPRTVAKIAKTQNNGETSEKSRSKQGAQRVLILASRGINFRQRHLLRDLTNLLPHGRRESKFDSKKDLQGLSELAEMYNCNNVLFLEARKTQDLYLHMAKAPNGPTARFHIQNLSTMEELNFPGNCMKGSRPILSFDSAFDSAEHPHLRLVRELLLHTFGVPRNARKSKPFVDHIMGFSFADGKIFVRHYQVVEEEASDEEEEETTSQGEKEISLSEIGPRFCMTPLLIQEGAFSGPIIYENRQYVSPHYLPPNVRRKAAMRRRLRQEQRAE